jgi:hypothetical protein
MRSLCVAAALWHHSGSCLQTAWRTARPCDFSRPVTPSPASVGFAIFFDMARPPTPSPPGSFPFRFPFLCHFSLEGHSFLSEGMPTGNSLSLCCPSFQALEGGLFLTISRGWERLSTHPPMRSLSMSAPCDKEEIRTLAAGQRFSIVFDTIKKNYGCIQ